MLRDARQRKAAFDLERERFALDRKKVEVEIHKLALEERKLELENRKVAVNLYVEDFKARWQELLNFENENNRWITLYVTALLLAISLVLNNSERYIGLAGLYSYGDNAYFVMSVAIVNAVYTFAMAFKGYQIQQIALYQYKLLAVNEIHLYNSIQNQILVNHVLMHITTLVVVIALVTGVWLSEKRESVVSVLLPLLSLSWAAAMVRFDYLPTSSGTMPCASRSLLRTQW